MILFLLSLAFSYLLWVRYRSWEADERANHLPCLSLKVFAFMIPPPYRPCGKWFTTPFLYLPC